MAKAWRSFHDPRNDKEAPGGLRGTGHQVISGRKRLGDVGPQPEAHIMGMGHWLNAGGRRPGQFTNPVQYGLQRGQRFIMLPIGEGQPGEPGKFFEVLGV